MTSSGKAEDEFSGPAADVEDLEGGDDGSPRRRHKPRELMPDDVEAEAPVGAFEVRFIGGGTFPEDHDGLCEHR